MTNGSISEIIVNEIFDYAAKIMRNSYYLLSYSCCVLLILTNKFGRKCILSSIANFNKFKFKPATDI